MKTWTIEYWHELNSRNSVEYWLAQLDDQQLECVTEEIDLLKLYGNSLKLPHSRPLKKKDYLNYGKEDMDFAYTIASFQNKRYFYFSLETKHPKIKI